MRRGHFINVNVIKGKERKKRRLRNYVKLKKIRKNAKRDPGLDPRWGENQL